MFLYSHPALPADSFSAIIDPQLGQWHESTAATRIWLHTPATGVRLQRIHGHTLAREAWFPTKRTSPSSRLRVSCVTQHDLPTSDTGPTPLIPPIRVFILSQEVASLLARISQTGFATFLVSFSPVLSSTNSLQLTGTIWFPSSLTAITTPNSFFAVEQK
jgi:hypothetical protein